MKKSHIAFLLVIGLAIMYLISTSGSYSQYANFATALEQSGKEFQIVGTLNKDKELFYEPEKDANFFSFYMFDKDGKEKKVVYKGTKPRDFERSEDIVLTGKMVGENFEATKILLKCPSKYNEGELEITEFEANS